MLHSNFYVTFGCHMQRMGTACLMRHNGRHLADYIFKGVFFNENVWNWIKISLKFVHKGLINKNPSLIRIMTLYHTSHKPLSEAMMALCACMHHSVSIEASKMADILKTTFPNVICKMMKWKLMKILVFWSKFHWKLFLVVQLTASQHWFR